MAEPIGGAKVRNGRLLAGGRVARARPGRLLEFAGMFFEGGMVGQAGEAVAHGPVEAISFGDGGKPTGQGGGVRDEVGEHLSQSRPRAGPLIEHDRMAVDPFEQEPLQLQLLLVHLRRRGDKRTRLERREQRVRGI